MHPFPNDPNIGRLAIVTESLDQAHYTAMCQRIQLTRGLSRCIEIETQPNLTWSYKPCRIIVISPRSTRILHQTLRDCLRHHLPVSISSTDYLPPEEDGKLVGFDDMQCRIADFMQRRGHLSFLQEACEEIGNPYGEDPYKAADRLFHAGLNERYIVEFLTLTS